MKVLVTLASSHLSLEIASSLGGSHEVRLTDKNEVSTDLEIVRSDLGHGAPTNELVRGMNAIVHSGEIDPAASVSDQLDYQMRCTYNLLWSAAEEGVQRFIYLSSLRLMDGYDPDLAVTERWKPLPTTNVSVLCYHLGEMICREFARENKISVVILRLGDFESEKVAKTAISTSTLYMDDAALAIEKALGADHSGWLDIYHIQSVVPNARYLTGQPWWSADDVSPSFNLGYEPRARS
jgi:hypothetical protein